MSEKPNPNALGGHVKIVDLTPQQRKDWHACCAAFMAQAPGFRYLWQTMLCKSDQRLEYAIFTRDIPTAATDGFNLIINPDFFFGPNPEFDREAALRGGVKSLKSRAERVFVLYHEVQHNVYNDVNALHNFVKTGKVRMNDGTSLPFEMDVAQRAADFRINALGVESKIGQIPTDCKCYDLNIAGPTTSFADAYARLYKKKQEQEQQSGGQPGDGSGGVPDGFDEVLPPGNSLAKQPEEAATERSEAKWKVEISIARSLSQGKLSAGLKKMFEDILEPEIYWVDHIRGFFNRKVGSGTYNWRKPDRRFIVRDLYMPGRTGFGAKHVVFLADTSGSIIADVEKGMAELTGIMEDVRPMRITVIWCDAAIHGVESLEDAEDLRRLRAKGAKGGGGSDMRPGFKWVTENCDEPPDALVCFTDLLVRFPEAAPSYPVVWCSVLDGKPPFGDYVRINKGGYDG